MAGPQMIDVAGVLMPPLTVEAFVELGERWWHSMRRQLIDDLDDAKVGDSAKAEAMTEHLQRRGLPGLVVMSAYRMDGAKSIIERAAKDAKVECPCIGTMTPNDLTRYARALALDEDALPKADAASRPTGTA